MKIGIYLTVIFLALVINNITANIRLQRSPQHYCGSRLADMMRLLCNGVYNEQNKRNQMDMEIWDYKDLEDNSLRPKVEAMSIIPARSQRGFKIIDECCYKPCYVSELRSYCGTPPPV